MTGMPTFSLATSLIDHCGRDLGCACGHAPCTGGHAAPLAELAWRLSRLDELWTRTCNEAVNLIQKWMPQWGHCDGEKLLLEGRRAALALRLDAETLCLTPDLGIGDVAPRWILKGRDGSVALELSSSSADGQVELDAACGLIAKVKRTGLRSHGATTLTTASSTGGADADTPRGRGAWHPASPDAGAPLTLLRPGTAETLLETVASLGLPMRLWAGCAAVQQRADLRFWRCRRQPSGQLVLESDTARLTLNLDALSGLWASGAGDRGAGRAILFSDHWGRNVLVLGCQPGFSGADHPLWDTLVNSLLD